MMCPTSSWTRLKSAWGIVSTAFGVFAVVAMPAILTLGFVTGHTYHAGRASAMVGIGALGGLAMGYTGWRERRTRKATAVCGMILNGLALLVLVGTILVGLAVECGRALR